MATRHMGLRGDPHCGVDSVGNSELRNAFSPRAMKEDLITVLFSLTWDSEHIISGSSRRGAVTMTIFLQSPSTTIIPCLKEFITEKKTKHMHDARYHISIFNHDAIYTFEDAHEANSDKRRKEENTSKGPCFRNEFSSFVYDGRILNGERMTCFL